MSLESIIEISFFAIFTGGLGTLFWARLNRLEAQIIDICRTMATREDLAQLRNELAVLRSDLTQVALAVGVNRPKPAEG